MRGAGAKIRSSCRSAIRRISTISTNLNNPARRLSITIICAEKRGFNRYGERFMSTISAIVVGARKPLCQSLLLESHSTTSRPRTEDGSSPSAPDDLERPRSLFHEFQHGRGTAVAALRAFRDLILRHGVAQSLQLRISNPVELHPELEDREREQLRGLRIGIDKQRRPTLFERRKNRM